MGLDQMIVPNKEDEPIVRFRKVNSLHGWVEDHLNDGEETNLEYITITEDDLTALQKDILDAVYNRTDAMKPREGFFFGEYEKNNHYYFDLGCTYQKMVRVREYMQEHGLSEVYYHSWW